MKTVRIREKIRAYISDCPRNSAEILEYINTTTRHGTTPQQLGNVLSKDRYIMEIGSVKRMGLISGGYEICVWAHSEWVDAHISETDLNVLVDTERDKIYSVPWKTSQRIRRLRSGESLEDLKA